MADALHTRIAKLDWPAVQACLDEHGHAVISALLTAEECRLLAGMYDRDDLFRKTVDMARHRFGRGQYRYFADPLPTQVAALREALYPPLARVANAWMGRLASAQRYPATFASYRRRCRAAGQLRPTPLLLDYGEGDYNCLHQDVYGELAFPLQGACLLSDPGSDFSGGEFLLVEQRPRMQSRGEVVALEQGDLVLFPNAERPVDGARRAYRVRVRHGVSRVRSGHRRTLGIIFHDAV